MIINKKALVLKEVLPRDEERGPINNLLITSQKTIATDGQILAEIENLPQELIEEFPKVDIPLNKDPVLLSPKTIEKIEKNLPKKPQLSILNNFVIGRQNGEIKIITTDLENKTIVSQKVIEGEYPNTEIVYPQGEPKVKIRVSIDLLRTLVRVVGRFTNRDYPGVDLSIYGEDKPILFEYSNNEDVKTKGLIMPMKRD